MLNYNAAFGGLICRRECRTDQVRCVSDTEYVCKVHCIRLASQLLFSQLETKRWFAGAGRQIIADLLVRAGKVRTYCGHCRLPRQGEQGTHLLW